LAGMSASAMSRRRGQPRLLRWPAEEDVTECFGKYAHYRDGGLTVSPGAALAAAESLWADRPPPRRLLMRAHRAVGAASSLDCAAFARLLHHVVVSLEVMTIVVRSASVAWTAVAAADDCKTFLVPRAHSAARLF
jgi:hypothetical protein